MKLTMKGDYGLRAMLDMAAYYGQGPIESADIARRQYIPEQYLDQILMALRKEGLVKSVRGPKGGHMLAKPPLRFLWPRSCRPSRAMSHQWNAYPTLIFASFHRGVPYAQSGNRLTR